MEESSFGPRISLHLKKINKRPYMYLLHETAIYIRTYIRISMARDVSAVIDRGSRFCKRSHTVVNDPSCRLCKTEPETPSHCIARCP